MQKVLKFETCDIFCVWCAKYQIFGIWHT